MLPGVSCLGGGLLSQSASCFFLKLFGRMTFTLRVIFLVHALFALQIQSAVRRLDDLLV